MKNIKIAILVFAISVHTAVAAYCQSLPTPSPSIGSVTSSSFNVSWNSVSYYDPNAHQTLTAFQYIVQVSTNNTFPTSVPTYTYGSNTFSATISASPSTTYYVRVGAIYGSYDPQYSSSLVVTTSAGTPPPPPVPAAPILTTMTNISASTITANWTPVYLTDSYTLDYSANSSFPPTEMVSYSQTATSKQVTGLLAGTLYYFRVKATNNSGSSGYSDVVSAWTVPDAPNATAATQITSTSFTANWNSSAGATGYSLDVCACKDFSGDVLNFPAPGTSFDVMGLTPRADYYYRVRAIDVSGTSLSSNIIHAVDYDHNYIRSISLTVPGKTLPDQVEAATVQQRITKFDYVDGLGRPSQSVSVQASPSHTDVVQPVFYDAYGRESVKYLPYTAESNGFFKENALTKSSSSLSSPDDQYHASQQYNFYQTGGEVAADPKPYAQTTFEGNMLNRVSAQGSPGVVWQPDPAGTYATSADHTVKSSYDTNGSNEVLFFQFNPITGLVDVITPDGLSYYDVGVLHAKKTKDEHNNEVIEYTDKDGHVLCKKVQYGVDASSNKLYAETHYLYNDLGDLIIVLPPEAVKALTLTH